MKNLIKNETNNNLFAINDFKNDKVAISQCLQPSENHQYISNGDKLSKEIITTSRNLDLSLNYMNQDTKRLYNDITTQPQHNTDRPPVTKYFNGSYIPDDICENIIRKYSREREGCSKTDRPYSQIRIIPPNIENNSEKNCNEFYLNKKSKSNFESKNTETNQESSSKRNFDYGKMFSSQHENLLSKDFTSDLKNIEDSNTFRQKRFQSVDFENIKMKYLPKKSFDTKHSPEIQSNNDLKKIYQENHCTTESNDHFKKLSTNNSILIEKNIFRYIPTSPVNINCNLNKKNMYSVEDSEVKKETTPRNLIISNQECVLNKQMIGSNPLSLRKSNIREERYVSPESRTKLDDFMEFKSSNEDCQNLLFNEYLTISNRFQKNGSLNMNNSPDTVDLLKESFRLRFVETERYKASTTQRNDKVLSSKESTQRNDLLPISKETTHRNQLIPNSGRKSSAKIRQKNEETFHDPFMKKLSDPVYGLNPNDSGGEYIKIMNDGSESESKKQANKINLEFDTFNLGKLTDKKFTATDQNTASLENDINNDFYGLKEGTTEKKTLTSHKLGRAQS